MSAIVRCSACHQRSRVAVESLGLLVACPRCGNQFVAESDEELIILPDAPVATVHPRRRSDTPRPPLPEPDDHPHPHHAGPNGLLISVALLPLGIPLLWLLVSAVTGRETVLSYAAPLAIAVGICGLCAGIALTHWTTAARIRAMLALVMLAYLVSGALYFLKQNWLVEARKNFTRGDGEWREFRPPDKAYTVEFPGVPKEMPTSPVEEWSLKAYQFADPKRAGSDVFVSAHGSLPKDLPKDATDEVWFAKVKAALLTSGAELVREEPVRGQEIPKDTRAREYELQFPEGQIKRVVRIVRTKGRVFFYLSVDGPFLTGDTPDVKRFLKSFTLQPKPKP
jgi:hypothetical protein